MSFPDNAPGIDDLARMTPSEIAALPVELLAILQYEIGNRRAALTSACDRFNQALTARYAERAREERCAAGKDTGTVRLADGDFSVTADLPKKVEWDQERLATTVARIRDAGENPAEYVEISIKVPERRYAAWPESIRAEFTPARTVRTGKPVFRITDDGDAPR